MTLKPTDRQYSADKVRFLLWGGENPSSKAVGYVPHVYVEAKIDFNDVRTGFRQTVGLNKALEIYSDSADLLWAEDMIQDVDPRSLQSLAPGSEYPGKLPEFVDAGFISRMETQFIQYLLRCFQVRIYRNFALNAYSHAGEPPQDFIRRCREMLDGPMRRELDTLHEVYVRRLAQIAQKYVGADDSADMEEAKAYSQNRDIFIFSSERIAGHFMRAGNESPGIAGSLPQAPGRQELEERLFSLELEAIWTISRLRDSYADKAGSIDEYVIHPNLKDIHFVRSCILWMPSRVIP
jgi:hypothetical protein